VWLILAALCVAVISRTSITTDISAFLPRTPTPAQEILVDQLRDGVVSRLILVGIEGAPPATLAEASQRLAAALRKHEDFVLVSNGDNAGSTADRDYLWRNRYGLSPAVAAGRFSAEGLRARLEDNLALLASPAGMLLRRVLPNDPTGELLAIVERLEGQGRPVSKEGAWFSPDGARALLVVQTRATGYDIDAQHRAIGLIRGAFAESPGGLRLLMAGPGVFSVDSRAAIQGDALRFSVIATALIAIMTLAFYRSPRVLVLGLVPVASGALAGIAAVSLGFGTVHGITLGFGVTLIGEGVDYAIFLFTRTTRDVSPGEALERVWPTLRLGVLTSICGFSAMLFSGFTGLAQLGLFSVVGIAVAATVTRWVLPSLMPAGFMASAVTALAPAAMKAVRGAPLLRYPLIAVAVLSAAFLALQRGPLWIDDLGSLSPVPRAALLLDQQLRRDIGAPDVRYLVVIRAKEEQAALEASERVAAALDGASRNGLLAGYDSPARYLPSRRMQAARQAALPAAAELRANLRQALQGLPYRPDVFEPFLKDAAAAKAAPLLDRDSLRGTSLALKVDSLLARREAGWIAMLPLRGVSDAAAIAREIDGLSGAPVVLLDLKGESDRLYADYRREAVMHSLLGVLAIVALLVVGLRSPRRAAEVLAPLAAAVVVTAGILAWLGPLSIFHLVGLLLVVAVGSNYSLFFEQGAASAPGRERTIVSLLFANVSTVIGFGLLAFSSVPVLHAIGLTVATGAILALVCSAVFCVPARPAG
jgi:predicted exporter